MFLGRHVKFNLVMWKNHSTQSLSMNLMKTIQNMPSLPGELYTIGANNNVPDDLKHSLVTKWATQNQKQANTRTLAKWPQLKIGTEIILKININIKNCVFNDQTGKSSIMNATGIVSK